MGWNCSGLGNLAAVQVLSELIKAHKLDIVMLFETLVSSKRIEELRIRVGFDSCFTVDSRGRNPYLVEEF